MPLSTAPDTVLNPAVRVLWRGPSTVQLELGARAVLLEGVSASTLRTLLAAPAGIDPHRAAAPDSSSAGQLPRRAVLAALRESGFLWSRPAARCGGPEAGSSPGDGSQLDPGDVEEDPRLVPPRPRLAPELTALSAHHGERGAEILNARRGYAVAVHGTGRVAGHVAVLLAASGIGRVHITTDAHALLPHAVPGGVAPGDEGRRFATAVAAAVARAAPEADTTALPPGQPPDLVVLAIDEPIDPDRRDALHARGQAHLAVRTSTDGGVVGPLVIPGLTSCLGCADLHRLDRDPAWNALAVQLSVRRPRGPGCDVAAATIIAGVATHQVLDFLDGGQPESIDGTIELHRPDWRLRRRSWPAHPRCDCADQPLRAAAP
jgi:hypothetical protein